MSTYDFNLDYQNNPDYNRYSVWASLQNNPTELAAYEAWIAEQSAAAINNPQSS
jgi:hypothetical protein